jgi:hypothetical protein
MPWWGVVLIAWAALCVGAMWGLWKGSGVNETKAMLADLEVAQKRVRELAEENRALRWESSRLLNERLGL